MIKIDEKFCVIEAAGIAAVVRTAHLADDLFHFGELRKNRASALRNCNSRGRTGARSERPANPDRSLIKVRQKFGADNSAEEKK